jgi:hypothetical protein
MTEVMEPTKLGQYLFSQSSVFQENISISLLTAVILFIGSPE